MKNMGLKNQTLCMEHSKRTRGKCVGTHSSLKKLLNQRSVHAGRKALEESQVNLSVKPKTGKDYES